VKFLRAARQKRLQEKHLLERVGVFDVREMSRPGNLLMRLSPRCGYGMAATQR
jgi:hypothetical protein